MILRRLPAAFAGFMLLSTGGYLFVYLYRWEWNRALVAGVLFLATEIGVVGAVGARRLRQVEADLDRLGAPPAEVRRLERRLRDAEPPPGRPFAWLEAGTDRTAVFVPILMGVGVIASMLAWAVERLARATGGRYLRSDTARHLADLSWPTSPLIHTTRGDVLTGPVSTPPKWR